MRILSILLIANTDVKDRNPKYIGNISYIHLISLRNRIKQTQSGQYFASACKNNKIPYLITPYFSLSRPYTLSMDDDIFFIPDTISIMSKLKEPQIPGLQEHSLSKIIREQALHYEEENFYV